MKKSRASWLWLGLIVLLMTQCGENNPLAPDMLGENEIWIQDRQFVPDELTVSKGATVKWTNRDDEIHTVNSGQPMNPTGQFNSANLREGEVFSFTFLSIGTFNFFCDLHGETGRVIVQ